MELLPEIEEREKSHQSKLETKIGNIGEELVIIWLRNKDSKDGIPYPAVGGPHKCDIMVWYKNGIVPIDVKTKPRTDRYHDTGIDIPMLKRYEELNKQCEGRFYLIFVDDKEGKAYGNFLDKLLKVKIIDGIRYPRELKGIKYFSLKDMDELFTLSKEVREKLRGLRLELERQRKESKQKNSFDLPF